MVSLVCHHATVAEWQTLSTKDAVPQGVEVQVLSVAPMPKLKEISTDESQTKRRKLLAVFVLRVLEKFGNSKKNILNQDSIARLIQKEFGVKYKRQVVGEAITLLIAAGEKVVAGGKVIKTGAGAYFEEYPKLPPSKTPMDFNFQFRPFKNENIKVQIFFESDMLKNEVKKYFGNDLQPMPVFKATNEQRLERNRALIWKRPSDIPKSQKDGDNGYFIEAEVNEIKLACWIMQHGNLCKLVAPVETIEKFRKFAGEIIEQYMK